MRQGGAIQGKEGIKFCHLATLKVDMLTNGEPVPELAFVCHASKAREKGKKLVAKMKEEIPRQQVCRAVPIHDSNL